MRKIMQQEISSLSQRPHLAIIQVGSRADSSLYVKMKQKAAESVGIKFTLATLPEKIAQVQLVQEIERLNSDGSVHGILVQLPLPAHIDESAVTEAVDPEKDVDGFHSVNAGALAKRNSVPLFVACTPKVNFY